MVTPSLSTDISSGLVISKYRSILVCPPNLWMVEIWSRSRNKLSLDSPTSVSFQAAESPYTVVMLLQRLLKFPSYRNTWMVWSSDAEIMWPAVIIIRDRARIFLRIGFPSSEYFLLSMSLVTGQRLSGKWEGCR